METYTVEEYSKDIAGYNVSQSVHVEAVWPGDPVGETRWACYHSMCLILLISLPQHLQVVGWNC